MNRWRRHLSEFVRSWAYVGAAYAMDCGVYPSGVLTYTDEWLRLYHARRAAGRPDFTIHLYRYPHPHWERKPIMNRLAITIAITLAACCEEPTLPPAPDASSEPAPCVYRTSNPQACRTAWPGPNGEDLGWCTNYETHVHGTENAASCNLQCGAHGECPPAWAPVVVDGVCICGEI